jgi:hypothetical protein
MAPIGRGGGGARWAAGRAGGEAAVNGFGYGWKR